MRPTAGLILHILQIISLQIIPLQSLTILEHPPVRTVRVILIVNFNASLSNIEK